MKIKRTEARTGPFKKDYSTWVEAGLGGHFEIMLLNYSNRFSSKETISFSKIRLFLSALVVGNGSQK